MSAVRDFPKIKAIRSFVIGGVGSGTSVGLARRDVLAAHRPSHGDCHLTPLSITQAATITTSRAATGKHPVPSFHMRCAPRGYTPRFH